MGKLVLERYDGATWSKLWEMSGNKGDVWIQAGAALPAGTTQLRFAGTTTNSYTSDFALDDLSISTKPVPVPTTTTTQGSVSSFAKVVQGTCQSNGLDPIYDKSGCSAAAAALGYKIFWGPSSGYPDVVSGCSARGSGLLFLERDDGSCTEGAVKGSCSCAQFPNTCLCKSRAGTSSTTTQAPTTLPLTTQAPATLPPTTQPPTPTTQPPMPTTTTTTDGDVIIPVLINASEADRVDIKVSIVK